MRSIRRTRQFKSELLEIYLYLAERNAKAAESVLDAVEQTVRAIARRPGAGRKWETSESRLAGIRLYPVDPYRNYLIFYRLEKRKICFYRLLHAARDLERLVEETTPEDSD